MIEATGAQIIVKLLERQGVHIAAGIPGGSILPLYEELSRSSIRHILVRHEQAGGFFAQGMARTTGVPAVCFATSGPGAMNLLTAIADARSDSIPLVAITGQVNSHLIGTDAFQEADTFGLSFPITKHSVMVSSPEELLEAVPRAFEIASSGRPGPVLIDVPRDVQTKKISFKSWPKPGVKKEGPQHLFLQTDASGSESFERAVQEACALIAASSRPVLYAGGGVNSPDASAALKKFLDIMPMSTVVSLMGIGAVPSNHPLLCGMVGMHGSNAANRAMYESDLVIAAGARFDDRAVGLLSQFCPSAKIIHIDIDAAEINKIIPSFVAVNSDSTAALNRIIEELKKRIGSDVSGDASDVDTLKKRAEAALAYTSSLREKYPAPRSVPGSFIASVPTAAERAGLRSEDLIIATDVGQHQMWTAQYYPFVSPRQFLTSGSLGTMGFGLPTAIGAAAANPGKRVICFTGDGSIMMNIQELATLAELNLDVTVILLDNGALGMVRQQQEFLYDANFFSSIFERRPDFITIAQGFGIPSVNVEDGDDSWEKTAFPPAGTGPRFIRYTVAQSDNVYPFVPAGRANINAVMG